MFNWTSLPFLLLQQLFVFTFMRGIYNNIPKTKNDSVLMCNIAGALR